MEKPYKGRATIQDNFTEVQIIIPAKRNWFVIVFLTAWLGGWFMGETFALGAVTGLLRDHNPASLFLVFWLTAWTAGGFFAFRTLLWNLKGKEIIIAGHSMLTIDKKGALLFRQKTYDLHEVKNIRIQDDHSGIGGIFDQRRTDLSGFNQGIIRFDYGLKTIRFGNGIDEAEARFILDKLKERGLLTEKNYLV